MVRPKPLALEYHPESLNSDLENRTKLVGRERGELEKKDCNRENKPLPKKKRSNRGKKSGKSKPLLQASQEMRDPCETPVELYDLGVVSSDQSESSQEVLEDSDVKKRRIEDKLWEEAFALAPSPIANEIVVNEESISMDSSVCNEANPSTEGC